MVKTQATHKQHAVKISNWHIRCTFYTCQKACLQPGCWTKGSHFNVNSTCIPNFEPDFWLCKPEIIRYSMCSCVFSESFHRCGCRSPTCDPPSQPSLQKANTMKQNHPRLFRVLRLRHRRVMTETPEVTVLPHTRLNWEFWRSDSLVFYIRSSPGPSSLSSR